MGALIVDRKTGQLVAEDLRDKLIDADWSHGAAGDDLRDRAIIYPVELE